MALIDYSFRGHPKTLHLDCSVAEGWRKAKKTYCFSETTHIEWQYDYALSTRISVFPWPISLLAADSQFVLDTAARGEFQNVIYAMDREKLELELSLSDGNGGLNLGLPWHTTGTGRLCIAWDHFVNFYRLNLLLVLESPRSAPPPIEREWCRRFFPGGLPSLGKNR